MDALDSRRLLEARTGTQQLLQEALVRLELLTEDHPSWLEELIARLAPADDRGYWLLTALATQDRAIGTAEAWLDRADLPGEVRDFLVHLLSMVLATGQGAELTEERLGAAVADALGRRVDVCEIAQPIRFSLAILVMTDDLTVRTGIITGDAEGSW